MLKKYFLLLSISVLSSVSVLILKSIAPELLTQQAIFFLIGFIAFFFASRLKYQFFQRTSLLFYLSLLGLLVLALLSRQIKGSARWIVLPGGFHLQPSQLAITFTSFLLTNLTNDIKKKVSWKKLARVLLPMLLPAFLIYIEPDFGSAMIFILSVGSILYFLPLSRWQYVALFTSGSLGLLIVFAFFLKPHQKQRLLSFSGSDSGMQENYNAQQALIAVGSGQIFGRGLGLGIQSHLRFLPERQTDFIFASIAEELGFIGSGVLLLAYFTLSLYIIYVAENSNSLAEKLFCYISAVALIIQAVINIGMNSRILPITGVTLPLVSYGGSSVIATLFTLGVIQAIALESKKDSFKQIR